MRPDTQRVTEKLLLTIVAAVRYSVKPELEKTTTLAADAPASEVEADPQQTWPPPILQLLTLTK